MAALTGPRDTPKREPKRRVLPVATNTTIHQGSIVVLASNYAKPGSTATGLIAGGVALETVVNTGANGAKTVEVERGVFRFGNSGTDPVDIMDIGQDVYIVDDQTVAATHGSNTRSKAGKCFDIDSSGVWVEFG